MRRWLALRLVFLSGVLLEWSCRLTNTDHLATVAHMGFIAQNEIRKRKCPCVVCQRALGISTVNLFPELDEQ